MVPTYTLCRAPRGQSGSVRRTGPALVSRWDDGNIFGDLQGPRFGESAGLLASLSYQLFGRYERNPELFQRDRHLFAGRCFLRASVVLSGRNGNRGAVVLAWHERIRYQSLHRQSGAGNRFRTVYEPDECAGFLGRACSIFTGWAKNCLHFIAPISQYHPRVRRLTMVAIPGLSP